MHIYIYIHIRANDLYKRKQKYLQKNEGGRLHEKKKKTDQNVICKLRNAMAIERNEPYAHNE